MRYLNSGFPVVGATTMVRTLKAKPRPPQKTQLSVNELAFLATKSAARADDYAPSWIEVGGGVWFVARVMSGREARVVYDLGLRGVRAYAPKRRDKVLQGRVGDGRREKRVTVGPALPGYVFVGTPGGFGVGKSMHDDVMEILGVGGKPLAIAPEMVAAINRSECEGRFDSVGRPCAPVVEGRLVRWALRGALAAFAVGEEVRFVEGPFALFLGVVAGLSADLALEVEVGIFGRATRMKVAACQVEKI